MAAHHARSVLAALALGAAVTVSGCAGSASSSNSPASVDGTDSGSTASPGPSDSVGSAQAPGAQDAPGDDRGRPGGSGSGADRPRWCTTEALTVSLRPGQPAAGNRYAALVLTNSSSAACRTQGWPGLQLTGANGGKIPTKVVRDHSVPSRQLTLSPGGHATARLHWTVVPGEGDPDDGRCPEPKAVRVIPPDQRTARTASWKSGEVCGAGEIDVRPLLPGAGPPS
ncbi:DUF4232 domain-containing protein [Streptomyces bathyalis]|uniref:DUF4232 domain-containing protein n=1 Tax=Streptomyces bathyalis TaxID=2710756 RepID=A0A7T1TBS0_9ACTN|nr:DUF4232 domain-containing protein [Streptomyces bathyalis]QPP10067.1 DUF4232 domain-containing protein [Streptomyces bathyalis]